MREFATCLGKPFAGIEQGFAGNTTDVETGAAEGRCLLHTGYSQAELRGANRPHIADRTCADHQNIEALCLSHSSIHNEMSLESGVRSLEWLVLRMRNFCHSAIRIPQSCYIPSSKRLGSSRHSLIRRRNSTASRPSTMRWS